MTKPSVSTRPVLSVYDFDGTLTFRDSLTLFLKDAFGPARYAAGMTSLAGPALTYAVGITSRDLLKQKLIARFLAGTPISWMEEKSHDFCARNWDALMRPLGLESVNTQVNCGATVTLCSASPSLLLKPFAERLGIGLIATELEIEKGVLTGRLSGQNCRCEQKVERLKRIYGVLSQYHLRAWGDTSGDKQLLEVADEPYFREFH